MIDQTTLSEILGLVLTLVSMGLAYVKRQHLISESTLEKAQTENDQAQVVIKTMINGARNGNMTEPEFQSMVTALETIYNLNKPQTPN